MRRTRQNFASFCLTVVSRVVSHENFTLVSKLQQVLRHQELAAQMKASQRRRVVR
jgi:hypothetical protein